MKPKAKKPSKILLLKFKLLYLKHWIRETLLIPPKFIVFKWKVSILGIDEKWLKDIFANLLELDLEDFLDLKTMRVMAYGSTVHVQMLDNSYEFTINENLKKVLYIHVRKLEKWVEAYRTNRLCGDVSFYKILKTLELEMDDKAEQVREILKEGMKK